MSKEAARGFVELIMEDEALRERTADLRPEEVLDIAKEKGFDFTADELSEIMNGCQELSLEELGAVAGGAVIGGPCTPEDKEKKIKDTYCYGDVNGRKHDYERILRGQRPFWIIFKKSFDVYKCKLCGHQMEKY